jgi:hypothetical protein
VNKINTRGRNIFPILYSENVNTAIMNATLQLYPHCSTCSGYNLSKAQFFLKKAARFIVIHYTDESMESHKIL